MLWPGTGLAQAEEVCTGMADHGGVRWALDGAVDTRSVRARNELVHVLFTDNPESGPMLCYLIAFLALRSTRASLARHPALRPQLALTHHPTGRRLVQPGS